MFVNYLITFTAAGEFRLQYLAHADCNFAWHALPFDITTISHLNPDKFFRTMTRMAYLEKVSYTLSLSCVFQSISNTKTALPGEALSIYHSHAACLNTGADNKSQLLTNLPSANKFFKIK